MKCKRCESERIGKNGNRSGRQCYICKDCGHQFTSEFGRHTKQEKQMAVLLYCLGLSFTAIGGMLHAHPATIIRWVRQYTESDLAKSEPKGEIVLELSEIWRFMQSKGMSGELQRQLTGRRNAF